MLDKKLLFHTQEFVFHDSCCVHSNQLASDGRVPGSFFSSCETNTANPEFSAVNPTFSESGAGSHDNTYCHSHGNISQMKYDPSYGVNSWLTVENLDDVDRLFRNCGPTFGGTGNDHELGWQSLSHAIEESEDEWTSNFSFFHPDSRPANNNPAEYGPSKLKSRSTSANDSIQGSASISSRSSFLECEGGGSGTPGCANFTNPSHAISVAEEDIMLTEPVDVSEKLHLYQSDGRRQNQCVENSGLFHNNDSIRLDLALPFGNSTCQAFTSSDIQRQKNSTEFDPFGYLLNHVPQMQVDYNCSDQIHFSPTSSEIKSSSTALTSLPQLETSYRSNQVQLTGISCGPPLEAPAVPADYSTESRVEESSHTSTGLGEDSMEESQFCQLQNVVARLDTGTRLRIRDGLFRLARSAKQRRKCAISDSCSIDDRDTGGGKKRENGFLEMETDTNPIDRSIAHLLFHRAG